MLKKDITHSGYFEGILQIRNATQEIIDFVEQEIVREDAHVAKVITLPGGADYLLGDNKFLMKLGKRLKAQFSGDLKVSARLFTQSKTTSKLVYRTTVLFRYTPFKVGERVVIRGKQFEISRMSTKITIKDKETGKSQFMTYDELLKEAKPVEDFSDAGVES